MKQHLLLTAFAVLALTGCSEEAKPVAPPAEAPPDPRVVEISGLTTLEGVTSACAELPPFPQGDTADLTRSCNQKLVVLITAERILNFESGLNFYKQQLETNGKARTIVAVAAGQALASWLRIEAPKASDSTLNAWRKQLPAEADDPYRSFDTIRGIIYDGLRS